MLLTFLFLQEFRKRKKKKVFRGTCVAYWCSSRRYGRCHQSLLSVLSSTQPLGGASVFHFVQIYRMHYLCVVYDIWYRYYMY